MYSVVYNALWNPIEDARLLKLDSQTAIDIPIEYWDLRQSCLFIMHQVLIFTIFF